MRTPAKRKRKPKTKKAAAPKGLQLEKMSLKELLELQKRVDKAVHDAQQRERAEILKKMKEIANDAGFSMDDLVGGKSRGRGKAKSSAIAKFQNPDNPSETWTGRGRKPNWLVGRLKKGAKIEQFAI